MKKTIFLLFLYITASFASELTTTKLELQNLDFSNSIQKDKGLRYGIELGYHVDKHSFVFGYENTETDTFQPPLPEDLEVNKYAWKYLYQLQNDFSLQASYIAIDDNLATTDGGHIYGLGATYKNIHFAQFFSHYKPFDIYQSDLTVSFKRKFGPVKTKAVLVAKYLKLEDYTSDPISKNAKKTYFTPGIKVNGSYKRYTFGVGTFLGKRVFAVMDDGLKVQHHGMEFEETYMTSFGKKIGRFHIALKYTHAKATELPKLNEDVIMRKTTLMISSKF